MLTATGKHRATLQHSATSRTLLLPGGSIPEAALPTAKDGKKLTLSREVDSLFQPP